MVAVGDLDATASMTSSSSTGRQGPRPIFSPNRNTYKYTATTQDRPVMGMTGLEVDMAFGGRRWCPRLDGDNKAEVCVRLPPTPHAGGNLPSGKTGSCSMPGTWRSMTAPPAGDRQGAWIELDKPESGGPQRNRASRHMLRWPIWTARRPPCWPSAHLWVMKVDAYVSRTRSSARSGAGPTSARRSSTTVRPAHRQDR